MLTKEHVASLFDKIVLVEGLHVEGHPDAPALLDEACLARGELLAEWWLAGNRAAGRFANAR